uniref:Secreted protein n=1 Tax=Streptomyces avermitilis TaxID=33903 RepID=A0A499VH84_STRAX|nr:hypothetical protein SAVMC3_43570 [Streptomyces avermitilis]
MIHEPQELHGEGDDLARHSRLRRTAVGAAVAATVLAAPGTAAAAGNTPPARPLVKDLQTGSKACAAGEDARPYVAEPPKLSAVLYDPDRTQVSGEFEVWWTDTEGAEQRRTYTTTAKLSGTPFTLQLPSDIPPTTVVSWRVRANDGTTTSPWSSAGEDGSACEFVYDDVNPEKAALSSPNTRSHRTCSGWTEWACTATSPWTRPRTTSWPTHTASSAAPTEPSAPSRPAGPSPFPFCRSPRVLSG